MSSRRPQPRAVPVEVVRELRAALLRPGQTADELVYHGDDARDTLHAAVFEGDLTIAAASVMREPFPAEGGPEDWRIRGMATRPHARRRGAGRRLLQLCIDHARDNGGALVWCNARLPARGFYERAGLVVVGGVFEIPDIGPHVRMRRTLAQQPPPRPLKQ